MTLCAKGIQCMIILQKNYYFKVKVSYYCALTVLGHAVLKKNHGSCTVYMQPVYQVCREGGKETEPSWSND